MSDRTKEPEQFAAPFGYPRILGTYVAVNAVPDLWMLVDSADCSTLRAEIVQDNHDWNSTLITQEGSYRIASSGVCPNTIVLDRRQDLGELLQVVASGDGALLLVCPAPVTALVGVDYRHIVAGLEDKLKSKILVVDPVDSVGDWVAGYIQITELLAEHVELPPPDPEEGKVALVGYLWDRGEGDHVASVSELKGLLAAIGVETTSVWLSGEPTASLASVAKAATIIALPYAGRAAGILAKRTGARVISAGLPVGLAGTVSWLEHIGEQLGRSTAAANVVARMAPGYYRKLAKAVARHFVNREFAICAESRLAVGLADMVREFGSRVALMAVTGPLSAKDADLADVVLQDGNMAAIRNELVRLADSAELDPVLIGNERAIAAVDSDRMVVVPIGFQSAGIHHLHDTPFLGFSGTLSLVDRIVNAIALAEIRRS